MTQVTLIGADGSQVTYKGMKILTNTSVSLQSGPGCTIPADPNSPTALKAGITGSDSTLCTTQVATIEGVNVSGLTNVILSAAVAIIAMVTTAT